MGKVRVRASVRHEEKGSWKGRVMHEERRKVMLMEARLSVGIRMKSSPLSSMRCCW